MENNDAMQEETGPLGLPEYIDVRIELGKNKEVVLPSVGTSETLHAVKLVLADFQETAFLTSFHLIVKYVVDADAGKVETTVADYGDFSVLSTFLDINSKELVLTLQLDIYDIKKIRAHIERFRDICNRSHLVSAIPNGVAAEEEASANVEAASAASKKADSSSLFVPKVDELGDLASLSNYFREVLCLENNKGAFNQEFDKLPLRNVIKGVYLSGWNPAPAARRLQGDLLYLEVNLASEGTVHITCTTRGFYVNKSNRGQFDPTPAAHPYFAHDLFTTISGFSAQTRAAWAAICEASKSWFGPNNAPGALDGLIRTFVDFNLNDMKLPTGAWVAPASHGDGLTASAAKPTYDTYRVQQNMGDLCGAEELGAPREWNDEIQSIRTLQASDLNERILKARLEYKIISEFADSCRKIVLSIADGLIAPLSYGVPSQSDIYVYNGIFISRAEDTKDAFHIYDGEEAARKVNSRDLANQRLIRSLEVEGLGSVLCTIVDYKGVRYVGQSIIPGILNQGEAGARLMYGIMEDHKPITVKESTLKVMKELADKLFLGGREIPQYPFGEALPEEQVAAAAAAETKQDEELDPLNKLIKSNEATMSAPIRVDEEDNVPVNAETQSVQHVGPIEAKVIKGTDGRTYLLELMRLTPRDANFVREKGTEKLTSEQLAKIDESIANTYILRQELIGIYLQRKVAVERQKLIEEAQGRKKEEMDKLTATISSSSSTAAAASTTAEVKTEDDAEEGDVKIVKEEASKEAENEAKLAALDEELENTLAAEYVEKFRAITTQSLGIEFNVNVFLNFTADVNTERLAKDEERVRDVANFLWEFVIPAFIKQIREGDLTPRDSSSLVSYLHRTGINIRYLGRLAQLAHEQEKEDAELILQGKQRVHSMPGYFLDLCLVEMIARATKHLLNNQLRENKLLAAAPANSIASLLNHIFAVLQDNGDGEEAKAESNKDKKKKKKQQAAAVSAAPVVAEPVVETDKKSKKKKGKKGAKLEDHDVFAVGADTVTAPVNVFASKEAVHKDIFSLIESRYTFRLSLFSDEPEEDIPVPEDVESAALFDLAKKMLSRSTLRQRMSPLLLLRRICQQVGLVVAAKDYDFTAPVIFQAGDILTLVPKVKNCEPETYLPEFHESLANSSSYLQQGNGLAAFEAAQQALGMINQVTGTAHEQAFQAMVQMTAVFISTADVHAATQMSARTLALSAQVQGLDCQETIQHHVQLGMLEGELGNLSAAFHHLLSAKYLIQLVGGDRHPELGNIFYRIASLYEKIQDYDSALTCVMRARFYIHDLAKSCNMILAAANYAFHAKRFAEALNYQKTGFKLVKELYGPEDERVLKAKKALETYIRASSEASLPQLQQQQQQIGGAPQSSQQQQVVSELSDADKERLLAELLAGDKNKKGSKGHNNSNNNKKTNKSKK